MLAQIPGPVSAEQEFETRLLGPKGPGDFVEHYIASQISVATISC